jgi:hypothetical protein
MKLWKIDTNSKLVWDVVLSMVVRAETKEKALDLFKDYVGDSYLYYTVSNDDVVEIQVDGEEEIICVDFIRG